MKFLQDKLPGRVNYAMYGHNTITGTDSRVLKKSYELSNVATDADRCSVAFQYRIDDGQTEWVSSGLPLKRVQDIVIQQLDQATQQEMAKSGHPETTITVSPAIFRVIAKIDADHGLLVMFYDETLAGRVTRALQHAVELCGGGNKDPF